MMKKLIKQFIKKAGYKLIPLGSKFNLRNAFTDQKDLISTLKIKSPIIFDVGAYNGYTASRYKDIFPGSKIYCFEPSNPAFEELESNMKQNRNIEIFNYALGNKPGVSNFFINYYGPTNSLLKPDSLAVETWGIDLNKDADMVSVKVESLDNFLKEKSISKIDILKMDTQGTELEILNGAKETINNSLIKIIYMEIILLPTYENQPGLKNTVNLLEDLGFVLYNFYDLSSKSNGQLRQLDAVFINRDSFFDF